jgi:AraC-like DNA-binding protein
MRAQAVGTMTRALVFGAAAGTRFFGVRFRPGVAGAALGLPASELTDARVALSDVWPDSSELLDAMEGIANTRLRIRALSRAIARRLLAAPAPAPPPAVTAATSRIEAARGTLSIADLCDDLGISRQHLARAFDRHVGVSPKTLARVVRARGVLARARAACGEVDWTALALDAGYYDQSHLIADVGELSGLTPTAWLAEQT